MKILKNIFRFVKRHRIITIFAIFALVIVFFVVSPKKQQPIPTYTVKRADITQTVSISGKVAAKRFVDLSFQIAGTLAYLSIKTGDHVNQFQTIATLDQKTAQKNLETALITYSEQRNTFDQTQSNNDNRTPDQALNDSMKRILQNNQFDLDKSVKSVELQELTREESILNTPIAGIVTRADANTAGVNVTPTAIFEIVDPTSLVFDMDVDEADIGKVTIGQEADIVLDPYSDQTIKVPVNFIDFVSHTTSNGGNAFTVEVPLTDGSGLKYRIGMNGNADIITNKKYNVITAPAASVVDNNYVYIKTPKGFKKQNVSVGLQSDTDVEIKKGLNIGDIIATDPTAAAKEITK